MYKIVHTESVGRIYLFPPSRSTKRNTKHDNLINVINNSLKEIIQFGFFGVLFLLSKVTTCCLKKSLQMRQGQKLLIQNASYYGNV